MVVRYIDNIARLGDAIVQTGQGGRANYFEPGLFFTYKGFEICKSGPTKTGSKVISEVNKKEYDLYFWLPPYRL
jgi:hypothetical protein